TGAKIKSRLREKAEMTNETCTVNDETSLLQLQSALQILLLLRRVREPGNSFLRDYERGSAGRSGAKSAGSSRGNLHLWISGRRTYPGGASFLSEIYRIHKKIQKARGQALLCPPDQRNPAG